MIVGHAELRKLEQIERRAYRALMNDPRVLADRTSEHTPEIKATWEVAADACRSYREAHGLIGVKW